MARDVLNRRRLLLDVGYQPGIAFLAAGLISPLATLVLILVALFGPTGLLASGGGQPEWAGQHRHTPYKALARRRGFGEVECLPVREKL